MSALPPSSPHTGTCPGGGACRPPRRRHAVGHTALSTVGVIDRLPQPGRHPCLVIISFLNIFFFWNQRQQLQVGDHTRAVYINIQLI